MSEVIGEVWRLNGRARHSPAHRMDPLNPGFTMCGWQPLREGARMDRFEARQWEALPCKQCLKGRVPAS